MHETYDVHVCDSSLNDCSSVWSHFIYLGYLCECMWSRSRLSWRSRACMSLEEAHSHFLKRSYFSSSCTTMTTASQQYKVRKAPCLTSCICTAVLTAALTNVAKNIWLIQNEHKPWETNWFYACVTSYLYDKKAICISLNE